MNFLDVEGLHKRFGRQVALKGINAGFAKGEFTCILGPSGCGKTTLLRIIAGLDSPSEGKLFIEGEDCTTLPAAKRNFGIVFQSYALFPNMTVAQNISVGLKAQKNLSRAARQEKVRQVLEMVDLLPHKNKLPGQLSGGQQQRTALARAVALSPQYLLLDEPLSALDAKVRVKLREEICHIQRELGITTIMVTHDQEEALTMADKIIVMNNAVIEQVGTPKEIYESPATPFVAGFIGSMNFYQGGSGTIAVRPEHISVHPGTEFLPGDGGQSWPVTVEAVEFRGASSRVTGRLPGGSLLQADITTRQAEGLALVKGQKVHFHTPERCMHQYQSVQAV